jgi:hypothetical protein
MSDDYINQLTLNCLINRNQLEKLNKKICNDKNELYKKNIELYKHRILTLFTLLLESNSPDDLLTDVHKSFELFITKSIYYFETQYKYDDVTNNDVNDDVDDDVNDDVTNDDVDDDVTNDDVNDDVTNDDVTNDDVNDDKPLNWFEKIKLQHQQQKIAPRRNIITK